MIRSRTCPTRNSKTEFQCLILSDLYEQIFKYQTISSIENLNLTSKPLKSQTNQISSKQSQIRSQYNRIRTWITRSTKIETIRNSTKPDPRGRSYYSEEKTQDQSQAIRFALRKLQSRWNPNKIKNTNNPWKATESEPNALIPCKQTWISH